MAASPPPLGSSADSSTARDDAEALVVRVTRFEHAFRASDQATIDELCDVNFVDHNAPDGDSSLSNFKNKVAFFKRTFPDLKEDMQEIITSGGTAATRWVLTGSLQEEFMGIAPTGQKIRVEGMNFYRLKNGRVTDLWTQFDSATMLRQLGVDGS
jgi:steroid delta-isomerase-like uncharacterized protein